MTQPADVLGAMITPAVLISAAALLLLSTSNRLSRVIDRIRQYLAESQQVMGRADWPSPRQHELSIQQLHHLLHRLLLLRAAVTGMYLTIGLLLATSITAGLNVVIPQVTPLVPISLGVLGAVCFLYCIVVLVREALIAVRATLEEIDFVQGLLQAREQPPAARDG